MKDVKVNFLYYSLHLGMMFNKYSIEDNDPVTDSDVRCPKLGQNIPQSECRKTVDQLANNPIAKGELLKWNDTNRKPFASILYTFLLVMFCAAVREAAVLQMMWPLSLDSGLP